MDETNYDRWGVPKIMENFINSWVIWRYPYFRKPPFGESSRTIFILIQYICNIKIVCMHACMHACMYVCMYVCISCISCM